jgi:hypothetical protein
MSAIGLPTTRASSDDSVDVEQISPLFLRLCGFALMTGAVGFIAHLVARSILTAAASGSTATFATHSLWVPVNALGAFGAALVVLGLSGLYASFAYTHERLALFGSTLIGLAWMVLGVFLSLYSMIVLPWLATTMPGLVDGLNSEPATIVTFGVGVIAELVGTILLAIPLVRHRAASTWIGYTLLASALMLVLGDFVIAPGGPATNVAINLVSNLGPMLLMVAVGSLGRQLGSAHIAVPQP